MKNYRFALTFLISTLFHLLLLAYFLHHHKEQGFKRGVGENPKIKISSFEFAPIDSQMISNPLPQQKKSSTTKTKKSEQKDEQNKSPKAIQKTQEAKNIPTQDRSKDEELKEKKESNHPNPNESQQDEVQNEFDQLTPQIPINESLSYQLADSQTKKIISEYYGAEFGQLGVQEQEYILNNLAYIGRITQSYLRYPPNAGMLAQSGGNVVEFYLHPNGDISDLKIIKKSGFILLDRNSIKTIEIAYKDYPHPKTKTLIRFFINYYLIRN